MTRAEQKAIEVYPLTTEDTMKYFSNEQKIEFAVQQNNRREGFVEGYEQAEKDTIERAVKWLKDNWRDYVWLDADNIIHFGLWESDFRKAMEE